MRKALYFPFYPKWRISIFGGDDRSSFFQAPSFWFGKHP